MREKGENHSFIVVLQIRPKFGWMLPMGVMDNHTKYEWEIERWRPGTGVGSARRLFKNLQFNAKIGLLFPKPARKPIQNGQTKGSSGYSTPAGRFYRAKGPSRALYLHNTSPNCAQKASKSPLISAH